MLEAGPEQVLRALLTPLRDNPKLFPPSVCAAAARVAAETGRQEAAAAAAAEIA